MKAKARIYVFIAIVAALLCVIASSAAAQTKKKMTPAEVMAALKPGQWVKMEGVVQKDFSVMCIDIKTLTGDLLEDDWEITAEIRKVDRDKQEFALLLVPIKIQPDTEFEDETGKLKSFADLKPGMLVEADGTFLKDGTFLPKEIENLSTELAGEPGLQNEVEIVGKVDKVNVDKRTVTVMGVTFHIIAETELKSALK
jgi:hypothetical protein